MAQTQLDNGISHARRFILIDRQRHPVSHCKTHTPGANLTQYHESGMALRPTFANIGHAASSQTVTRLCVLTMLRFAHIRATPVLDADPVGLAQKRAVRIALFFRMARTLFRIVYDNDHGFLYAIFRDEYRSS